ncbi:MAG TPA: PKD domain-containing protein [Thermoanaerobaculia bacterium]|nr:PKD domain-containing protein [Thermoanaerobaculia bacterium]
MTYPFSSPSSFRRSMWGVVGAILAAAVASPAAAQTCPKSCVYQSCGTPAVAVPINLWGDLESAEPQDRIPGNRDSTEFQEFGAGHTENSFDWFSSIDIEGGTVFTATGYGVIAWTPQANGDLVDRDEVGMNEFPQRAGGELSLPIQDVDAPTGSDDVVALSGFGAFGLAVVDSRNLEQMRVLYQDKGQEGYEVYATSIGGRHYAFLATNQGIKAYDLTAVLGYTSSCEDETRLGGTQCSGGVYEGLFGRSGAQYVDGTGNYVVASYGSGRGLQIWNVANPAAPQLELNALTDRSVFGVALWADGAKHYLALVTTGAFVPGVGQTYEGHTYDVSCISGTCGSIGGPLDTIAVGQPSTRSFATFSRAGARPFVYFGNDNRCIGGKRETLVDVSNPANMVDVSPQGYWESISHLNRTWSGRGKFDGDVFYRAANSVFDTHRLAGGAPPNAAMAFPSEVYAGIPATFTDTSTGLVETRQWSFDGASPASSSLPVVAVTFGTVGAKSVSLQVGNGAGSDTEIETVTVLDPTPSVGGIDHRPAQPQVCQQVTLDADATGPNLAYAWTIVGPNQQTITGTGDPLVVNTSTLPAGTYTATVVASNGFPPAATAEHQFTLAELQALPAQGFAISHGPLDTGSVTLDVDAVDGGAAEWQWDFDADQNPNTAVWGASILDPTTGPKQTRTFPGGTFTVRARVRNCQSQGAWVESAPLQITIVNPLVAGFAATGIFCDGGECGASTNQAISFRDTSTGDPETWFYAWNNTSPTACTGYDAGNDAPVTSHTYTSSGFFFPCLKVQRGTASDEIVHATGIRVTAPGGDGPGDPPPTSPRIIVTGPVSGQPGTAYNFTASASNCAPTANGWTWTTTGGAIDGASNGTSISVSWSTAGSKSVTARNSACGSALGSRSINISAGPGDGTVVPQFSVAPTAPRVGQSITFNASATSGSVDGYSWSFGDGTTGIGQQVSHTYTAAGTYTVELSVGVAGCGISPTCFKSLSKSVVVVPDGGGGDPDPDPDPGGGLAADFTLTPAAPRPGEPVSFDGGPSTGSPVDFTWSFGDGGTASGRVVSHTFAAEGDYTVTLTVASAGCTSPGCLRSTSKLVQVRGDAVGANGCSGALSDDPDKLCLGDGRYVVEVDWENHHVGDQVPHPAEAGRVRRLQGSESTGFFWFFNPDSIDLIVKIIDGTVVNEHVWVFYGALTDVIYDLKVTDTLTNQTKTYRNLANSICGRGDTTAFSMAGLELPAAAAVSDAATVAGEAASEELALLGGRFKVTVEWENQHVPEGQPRPRGVGKSIAGTDGSGYFYFFEPSSLDLVVKMIDATSFDGHYWVFYGGLSDVEYTLRVEDTVTGDTWERVNPPGSICGGSDTAAFSILGD